MALTLLLLVIAFTLRFQCCKLMKVNQKIKVNQALSSLLLFPGAKKAWIWDVLFLRSLPGIYFTMFMTTLLFIFLNKGPQWYHLLPPFFLGLLHRSHGRYVYHRLAA